MRYHGGMTTKSSNVIKKTLWFGILAAGLCGCSTARVASRHEVDAAPATKPVTVYVSDFDVDTATVKADKGLLPFAS